MSDILTKYTDNILNEVEIIEDYSQSYFKIPRTEVYKIMEKTETFKKYNKKTLLIDSKRYEIIYINYLDYDMKSPICITIRTIENNDNKSSAIWIDSWVKLRYPEHKKAWFVMNAIAEKVKNEIQYAIDHNT